jgi:hypothetical protein
MTTPPPLFPFMPFITPIAPNSATPTIPFNSTPVVNPTLPIPSVFSYGQPSHPLISAPSAAQTQWNPSPDWWMDQQQAARVYKQWAQRIAGGCVYSIIV